MQQPFLLEEFGSFRLLFALAEADLLHDGRKRLSYDLDHLAGDQRREDRALSDTDARIPEGDQVQANDRQDHADQDDRAVHDSFDLREGLADFLGDRHRHALHRHRDKIHVQIEKYSECYEYNADTLHSQTSNISSGEKKISDHPLREIDKIAKYGGKDNLEQVDRIKFLAENDDLHKDVEAKYDRHTGAGLHFYNSEF